MHQIRFRLGLRPRPRWGSSQHSSKPRNWISGVLLLTEWEGREGEGGERKGRGKSCVVAFRRDGRPCGLTTKTSDDFLSLVSRHLECRPTIRQRRSDHRYIQVPSKNHSTLIPSSPNLSRLATAAPLIQAKFTGLPIVLKFYSFGQNVLIWTLSFKFVATRWHLLRLKCTKFDLGWGSASDPLRELTALSQATP